MLDYIKAKFLEYEKSKQLTPKLRMVMIITKWWIDILPTFEIESYAQMKDRSMSIGFSWLLFHLMFIRC